ncbi:MAG: restriction endonuclease subunit S [Clostridia bacterium]|nr:restriction endonuclease subunit S [Clostridia bacterium]
MEYRLDELFDLQMGKTPARKNPEYWNSNDYKWISIADLSKCEKYITETKEHISSIAVQESGISEIPANTVIMSFKLSIGKTAITKEPIYSNEAIMSFRDKGVTPLLPDYIYYMFSGRDWSKGSNTAVMGTTLNKATLSQIRIYVHAYEDQKRIVELLDKVSSIISKRKQELVELDDLIKARFVEMFGNPATPGDKFKTCKLGEVADVKSSHRVFTTEFVDEGVPFYRGTEIGVLASGQRPEDPYRISMEHYLKIASDDSKPIRGDLLLPSICNKGQVWMVDTDEPFYYKDGRVLCISPNQSVFDPRYLQLYMKMRTEAEYPKLGSGSTFAEFKIFQLKKLEIDIPPMDLQNQFAEFVTQIDKSKLLSGCRLFHSWAPENRDKPKHVGVPRRRTKDLRGGRRQQ